MESLKALGTAERAIQDARYHKSSREHWGVTAPVKALWVKKVTQGMGEMELLAFAKTLWDTNLFDPMTCAAKILSLPKVKPSASLWNLLLDCLKNVDGWALEDCLAHAAWKCLLADPALLDSVEIWTTHSNFWMRRAALVYTLPFAKRGACPERMLTWASRYATDHEWFIQKAIGWWLRDLGAHNPERVHLFLCTHWDQLKYVARKEGTRKLDAAWQKKVFSQVAQKIC